METVRIPFTEMKSRFTRILQKHNFPAKKAEKCADVFAVNSLEGVYSHGVYRFSRFIEYLQKGYVITDAEPELIHSAGALEQWNGNSGPGILNAQFCTDRAMSISDKTGIGCVAIANTNHWMRGGTYGWQAAKKGYVFIGWTNTIANMPAWGAMDSKLGNNPLVFAVPYGKSAIVLDFAMTQFSYGKLEALQLEGKNLPFAGGYNKNGELTRNPSEILESERALPIGYWKGASLSLLLDIVASILSAGSSTSEISKKSDEIGVSQVFITLNTEKLSNSKSIQNTISTIINDLKSSAAETGNSEIRYPGERVLRLRNENLQKGIPVNKSYWNKILVM